MKRKKNEELNFLYINQDETTKKKKSSLKVAKTEKKKEKKKQHKKEKNNDTEKIFQDNEIIIGVKQLPTNQEKKNSLKTKNYQKTPRKTLEKKNKKGVDKRSTPSNKQKRPRKKKKKSLIKELIKWTILLGSLMAAIVFFMMSPLFNVAEIEVTGNVAIPKETIISLSGIRIEDNIYQTTKERIRRNIKQNAYIESVEVKRSLPNKIELIVKERNTTYMLEYAGSFIYINNQGYILEITTQGLDVPIIIGYTTNQEDLQVGARLNQEDLNQLEMVLKIKESMEANGITSKVNRIDIANKQNYILYMEEEKKRVYLGDASNLSNRMLYLKAVLEDTRSLEGEIFVSGDLIKEKAFFRPKE